MSEFVDQQMVRLSDPAQLTSLVDPPGDPQHGRVRALLGAAYTMEFATIHGVSDVQVRQTEFQRPVFPPRRTAGTWFQTMPPYTRTDLALERHDPTAPVWVDLAAELGLTLLLDIDVGDVQSVLSHEITDFATLDEFRSRFRFIDLDAFMAKHDITTVEELREAFHYLITEVRLRFPGPFDPNDPANRHRYDLKLAILIRETLDVAAALRDAKLARTAMERAIVPQPRSDGTEVRTPYAPVLLFPVAAVPGPPLTQSVLESFFASEGVLTLFV
ncbi:hypothetical protein ACFQ6S_07255 [Streptomyces sp. NPDC056479]|uniref:hypothetical protein n=1 Tax=Streptomyces sp. NPDC056479 TaxID=3345832 RepID=UPI0036765A55